MVQICSELCSSACQMKHKATFDGQVSHQKGFFNGNAVTLLSRVLLPGITSIMQTLEDNLAN